ncbi:tetratricopeptide (TPR) repeat protein [Algoriphagus sp. 4150]|uniref:tetratricopeptide repeat-containing sensor histidine kinase n=1 Tax=Algoriphagus sp. 4150 TaxID=2817756 RepID=UPI00285AC104|nr:tetratricopeptide repeat protein [Algoriphagus sp. 4150]MDR7129710.1 tetratricopeptide (TPR) repeat protein [Algoriphagus sp. 4150]
MKAGCVFFLLLACIWAHAQGIQKEIDSLTVLLDKHPTQDTVRLHLLNEISYAYYSANPKKGLETAEEAIVLAKKLSHLNGLASAYSRKGTNHWALGQDSLAMEAINESLAYRKETGNMLEYAKGLNNRALNHYNIGNYTAAIRDHEEAAEWFEKLDFSMGLKHQWNNMGVVFLALDDYPRALDVFLKAERIAGADLSLQAGILSNIGLVYKNTEEYSQSLKYQLEALGIYRNSGNKQGEANALSNLATLYDHTGKSEEALAYYEESLKINKEIGNDRKIAGELTNIGAVYLRMNQLVKAKGYLSEAVELYASTNDYNGLSVALSEWAECYAENPGNRLLLQHRALDAAVKSGSPLRQSHTLKALSDSYEKAGNFELALQNHKLHIAFRDSVFNEEKKVEIVRSQMQFDFGKKEALIEAERETERALAIAEIKRQTTVKKAAITGGAGLLMALVTAFVLYKRRRDALAQKKEAEFRALVSDTELKALRSQMNPHFIFNSLNSIGDYVLKNDNQSAQDYLAKFAKLMRTVLENSEHKEIPLSEDLKFIELYLQVETKRLPGRFSYAIHVEEGLNTENTLIPPLILQPFIENSIWHGFKDRKSRGHIVIDFKKKDGTLLCSVDDNGTGRTVNTTDSTKKSLGVAITENRIKILNKQNNANGKLLVIDKLHNAGTRVELSLPLQTAF